MSRRPEAVLDVMGLKLHVARECRRRLRNWPVVVAKIGISHLGSNRGAFTAVTRSGAIVQAPNVVGSRDPIIEVLGCDAYHLDSTRWEDQAAAIHVLDIGAHVGSFTCAVAAKLPRARFTCVEPSASARSWLTKNLPRNGLATRAEILPVALAERDESVQLWDPGQASAEASLWRGRGPGTTSTVEGRSLWSLITRHAPPPTMVNMDCEGAEYAAILTSPPGTWDSVEHVILEYHPVPGAHFSDLRRRLEDLGFHLEWHAPDDRDPNLGMACFDRTP